MFTKSLLGSLLLGAAFAVSAVACRPPQEPDVPAEEERDLEKPPPPSAAPAVEPPPADTAPDQR